MESKPEGDLTLDERAFIKAEYDMGTPLRDIGDILGVHPSTVCRIAKQEGCKMRSERSPRMRRDVVGDGDANETIEALEETIAKAQVELRKLKAQKEITFDYDADRKVVKITGVDRLFIAHEGIPRFREWLVKQFALN